MLKNIKCKCGWEEVLDVVDGEYIECPECDNTYMINLNEQRMSYTTYEKCVVCGELYENHQLINHMCGYCNYIDGKVNTRE